MVMAEDLTSCGRIAWPYWERLKTLLTLGDISKIVPEKIILSGRKLNTHIVYTI